jgi:ferredoxin-NADP reductase
MKYIDNLLNSITMYKLVLYGLFVMALYAAAFEGPKVLIQLFVLFFVCYGVNTALSKIFKTPMNAESSSITALILFFLIAPYASWWVFVIAGVVAMLSKYVLVYKKKHILNPAIAAAFILTLFGIADFTWWVGSSFMLPVVLIVGLLIVRKLRRFYLFASFLIVAVIAALIQGANIAELFLSWPLVFFGTIMLTEPLSTPPTHRLQIVYGAVVGVLFGFGPVTALLIGNIFSYFVSPKQLLVLKLKEKKEIAENIWEFIFSSPEKLKFKAGQYAEWTLPLAAADSRGNRRYFTIASAPSEEDIHLGIRVNKDGSSYKKALLAMNLGDPIAISQISGDFTLPEDKNKKLVFIAGGIGVTPFRSMIAADSTRDVVLFYLAMNPKAFAYKEVFEKVKTIYADKVSPEQLAEYKDRTFYISGPNMMVDVYKKMLKEMGVKEIITDYFPGY